MWSPPHFSPLFMGLSTSVDIRGSGQADAPPDWPGQPLVCLLALGNDRVPLDYLQNSAGQMTNRTVPLGTALSEAVRRVQAFGRKGLGAQTTQRSFRFLNLEGKKGGGKKNGVV